MLSKPMKRSDKRAALTEEVARFQAEVQRLAFETVRAVIKQELDRKLAKLESARPRVDLSSRNEAPATPATPVPPAAATPEQLQLQLQLPDSAPVARPQPPNPPAPTTGRKRVPWTRESIINELASWMSSGTVIDAPFVTRHGPPGLVAATRRVFGRFEAALNVAGLHVSKLYPDGPPGQHDRR